MLTVLSVTKASKNDCWGLIVSHSCVGTFIYQRDWQWWKGDFMGSAGFRKAEWASSLSCETRNDFESELSPNQVWLSQLSLASSIVMGPFHFPAAWGPHYIQLPNEELPWLLILCYSHIKYSKTTAHLISYQNALMYPVSEEDGPWANLTHSYTNDKTWANE